MATDSIQLTQTVSAVKFYYFNPLDAEKVWNPTLGTPAYEAWNDANYSQYGVSATQQGTSKRWTATRPAINVPFRAVARQVVDGTLANDTVLGGGDQRTPDAGPGTPNGLPVIGVSPLTNLDAAISSRSTYTGTDTSGITTLLGRITGLVPLASDYTSARASKLDNLDAAVTTRMATFTYVAPDNTSIAAIKSKTDNLPADPASAGSISTAFGTVNSTLATIAGYIDTEVAAIKTKTDNLPSDPASASVIATAFTNNATAVSGISTSVSSLSASVTNVLNRIGSFTGSGANTILGFFRALLRSTSGLTPSDVGGTFDNTTDSLEAVRNQGDAAWADSSTELGGPSQVTLTFTDDDNNPVPYVSFTVQGVGSGKTDAAGEAVFGLEDGTYTVLTKTTNGVFFDPVELEVSGETELDITGTGITIAVPAEPGTCTAYLFADKASQRVSYKQYSRQGQGTLLDRSTKVSNLPDNDLKIEITVYQNAHYKMWSVDEADFVDVYIPAVISYQLPNI